jgi:ATP-dependent helicase/nuclease subunit A
LSRALKDPLPAEVRRNQMRAADPLSSVWVAANAGSGKTHVLTQRVLRLLLSGVAPDAILCLTYTKAAASVMRDRVATSLGKWAVVEEAKLADELTDLCEAPPDATAMRRARTLFAHALETPGGLKIQTIHAFCESVLQRFPLEAGVPFGFEVLEEHERDALLLKARESVLAGGLNGDREVADAVESLFELFSDGQLNEAIGSGLGQARKLRPILRDRALAKANLLALVGAGRSRPEIEAAMTGERLMGPAEIADLLAASPGKAFEEKLRAINPIHPSARNLLDTFLTQSRTIPKSLVRKEVRQLYPALADLAQRESERLFALHTELRRAELIERSESLLDVLGAISNRYESDKRSRALLDFDDLIEHAVALFENPELGDWVRYKLDAAITHILVDESQDTNPEQWRAVDALVDEFFAGRSAIERPRTLFAVGDVKQSIHSFQGAEPQIFVDSGQRYRVRAEQVQMQFDRVPLHVSFRTLPNVLAAVDLVFAAEDKQRAVLDREFVHDTARAELGGMVTLWPPIQEQDPVIAADEWPLEVNKGFQSAPRQVAEKIAGEIKRWIADRRPLGPRQLAVKADDILILVQIRGALFRELIRALHREGIPTPGADRLEVTSHIGILDLMALGDVVLNPRDSLQLAALLRSPFFDVSEEELFAIASPRKDFDDPLWEALRDSDRMEARTAYNELKGWRDRLDFDRPFEFYAHVLYGGGGLQRFHRRFGNEVDDVFAEFLDLALEHEQSEQPSLQGFLAAMRSRDVSIARELSEQGGGVRVMTVHGAKGLEAPIVILADAATKPMGSQVRSAVHIDTKRHLFIHASRSDSHTTETEEYGTRYKDAQMAEYWRKLYVAMTRAEDELYVTGTLTKMGKVEGTWYEAIEQALAPEAEIVDGTIIYPRDRPPVAPVAGTDEIAEAARPLNLPALPTPTMREVVRPSTASKPTDIERVYETAAEAAYDADTARKRGIALHALLQHLPRVPRAEWDTVAAHALEAIAANIPEQHESLVRKAIAILTKPDHAELFGPSSRAEVPFLAPGKRNGKPILLAGRIDRLVATAAEILIVDFKSDANPPETPDGVPPSYLTQLALYAMVANQLFPGRAVKAAILWTALESLMELAPERLTDAAQGFTID